ncbi:MAG: type II toxin-antitoxin system VapC family toxin [Rhodothermia bacterium]|nr:type II toxin-antitoxin system VapC family toxin [Rhodothermia bacterium]
MKYLLDTHILLWWRYDDTKLSDSIKRMISLEESVIFISFASIWELEIKTNLGKLPLLGEDTIESMIQDEVNQNAFHLLPIKKNHLFALKMLENHHRDPFDRMLIIQAQTEQLTLITDDTNIHRYNVPILKNK